MLARSRLKQSCPTRQPVQAPLHRLPGLDQRPVLEIGGESDESDHHQRFSPFMQVHCTDDGERGQNLET